MGIIALAIGVIENQKKELEKASTALKAENSSQECALLVNALFANTETTLKNNNFRCFAGKEFEIKSAEGETQKSAFSIAKQIKTTRIGKETVLEVKTNAHYK